VNDLDNVYLYNIDQLQRIADAGVAQRQKQIEICRGVIREFLEEKGIEALSSVPKDHPERGMGEESKIS
jgi:glutamyl-tRNA reductase